MVQKEREATTDTAAGLLRSARSRGITLWAKDGELHYKAPQGALTQEEIGQLRSLKSQIVARLEGKVGVLQPDDSSAQSEGETAPLAFSQLAYWYIQNLRDKPSVRPLAVGLRLRGHLRIDVLEESIAAIVGRHEALRAKIRLGIGVQIPRQEIRSHPEYELGVIDLSQTPTTSLAAEINRRIDAFLIEPVDIGQDPMLAVRVIKTRDYDHTMVIALEHMVADGTSLNIVVKDLFRVYASKLRGAQIQLPCIEMQFGAYAHWQKNSEGSWTEAHANYWRTHLYGCGRVSFPSDVDDPSKVSGWGIAPFKIGAELKAALVEWCRQNRTTIVMATFTAYAALVLRWCAARECVFQYQSNSRVSPGIENTVGFFASALYLLIRLNIEDDFGTLLRRVTNEYCQAYEHADFSYLASREPAPPFIRNAVFNWSHREYQIDISALAGTENELECSAMSIEHPMIRSLRLDHEPIARLSDDDHEIRGEVYFPCDRISMQRMRDFSAAFVMFVHVMVLNPRARIEDIAWNA